MATPADPNDYIEIDSTTGPTLLLGSRHLFWASHEKPDEFLGFGMAKGPNIDVPGANGEIPLPSVRAAMDVELQDVVIDGAWDVDNNLVSCTDDEKAALAWQTSRSIVTFFDSHCPGRLCTVTVQRYSRTYSTPNVKFLGLDPWVSHLNGKVLTSNWTFRVPTGVLEDIT